MKYPNSLPYHLPHSMTHHHCVRLGPVHRTHFLFSSCSIVLLYSCAIAIFMTEGVAFKRNFVSVPQVQILLAPFEARANVQEAPLLRPRSNTAQLLPRKTRDNIQFNKISYYSHCTVPLQLIQRADAPS
jgi:hypothetical protein